MFESEEGGVDEDEPTNHAQDNQAVAEGRLIEIKNLPRVKVKFLTKEKSHVHDYVGTDENSHFDSGHLSQPCSCHCVPLSKQNQEE